MYTFIPSKYDVQLSQFLLEDGFNFSVNLSRFSLDYICTFLILLISGLLAFSISTVSTATAENS